MSRVMRSTDIRGALRSRQRGFLLNPFRFGGTTPSFNYTAFLSGVTGVAWLADATHYQDTGRTAIAAVGDGVGSLSGTGGAYHAAQGTAGAKPLLQQASGKKYLRFDGVDDYLTADGGSTTWDFFHVTGGVAYLAMAVKIAPSSANPDKLHVLLGSNRLTAAETGFGVFFDDRSAFGYNNSYRVLVGNGNSSSAALDASIADALPPQSDCVLEIIRNGAAVSYYRNGTQLYSGSYGPTTTSSAPRSLVIGAIANLSGFSELNVYGVLLANTNPSAANRTTIQSDMAARCVNPPTIA